MDFSPITNHVQEWPCDALIGICDADHCGSQHIRYYPKSSNWSRLPEGKKTEESSIQKTILSSWKLCKFFGKGSVHSNQLNQTWVTKLRTTPQESCETKKMESDIQMYQANPSILREGAPMQASCLWIRSRNLPRPRNLLPSPTTIPQVHYYSHHWLFVIHYDFRSPSD